MNAHSATGALSSEPFAKIVDECLIEGIANASVDNFHHCRAIERRIDRIDMEMQMRRGDAELEEDGAIGAGRREQRAFGAMMLRSEMRVFVGREIGDILDMRFPNNHRMSTHRPVLVQ